MVWATTARSKKIEYDFICIPSFVPIFRTAQVCLNNFYRLSFLYLYLFGIFSAFSFFFCVFSNALNFTENLYLYFLLSTSLSDLQNNERYTEQQPRKNSLWIVVFINIIIMISSIPYKIVQHIYFGIFTVKISM